MMKKRAIRQFSTKAMTLGMVCALALVGCETTGQGAGLGAVLGGAAGAIIGHQSGHALEGAVAGAIAGGVAGAIISDVRQKQIASREQVMAEYASAGTAAPTTPTVYVNALDAAPDAVQYGQKVHVAGEYTIINVPPNQPANGTLTLFKDGHKLHEQPVKVTNEGRNTITYDLNTPEDLYPGEYVVRVDMHNAGNTASKETTFVLNEA